MHSGAVVYKDFLRHTNLVVTANSERFVIAREEPLLGSLVRKGKLDQWQPGPRFKTNAPDPYAGKRPESHSGTDLPSWFFRGHASNCFA